jgi:hypothetical protein
MIPVDYESSGGAPPPPIAGRFCLITCGGAALGFLAWCGLDYLFVRYPQSRTRVLDWALLLFPVAIWGVGAAMMRRADSSPRIGLAILAAILATVAAWTLIVVFGLPFHGAIGGTI